jgi:GAF domain-containing protein
MDDRDLYNKSFSFFQEISSAIVNMVDINSIANHLLDLAVNYVNAEKGSLMLLNEKEELYILAARDIDIQLIMNYKAKIGEGIAGIVAKICTPVLVEDIEKDLRFKNLKRAHYKTKSFISCPVVSRKKLLGVLNINDSKNGSPFTQDDLELIKIIADQAAIALENAFLMNQLKSKAVEVEEINRKLIETDVSKTEFLTRISHELRTPLNSIKGAIYYLQGSEPFGKDERKEFYDIISGETGNLISVIENLLAFIRLEGEMKVLSRTIINVSELLKETLNSKILRDKLTKRKLLLKLDIADDTSDIAGDKIKITQFFINLIEGLSNFLKEGDTIGIRTRENDFLEIYLDLPRRMPETISTYLSKAKKIFDPDQPEEIVKLYFAKKVADVHFWNIEVNNKSEICSICIRISKNKDQKLETAINASMDMFVEFISDILNVNICSVMLSDKLTGELTIKGSRGLNDDVIKRTRIRPGDKIAGWVALEGKPLLIENIEDDFRFRRKSDPQYSAKSLISLPIKLHDVVVGVLNLNNKKDAGQFTTRDLHIASLMSDRVAHFIEKLSSGGYSESDFRRFVKSFNQLLDARKKYHKDPLFQDLFIRILDELGASEEDKRNAEYIAEIYDFGLMLIDEDILGKKTLSPAEKRSVKCHPYNTVLLLDSFEYSEDIKKTILHHHERFDGTGYPDRLKAEEIPFLARVIAVVDAFCAMIKDRPYRKQITREKALEEIMQGAGSLYDPAITVALKKSLLKDQSWEQTAK